MSDFHYCYVLYFRGNTESSPTPLVLRQCNTGKTGFGSNPFADEEVPFTGVEGRQTPGWERKLDYTNDLKGLFPCYYLSF